MELANKDREFDQVLERVLEPDPDFWANRKEEIRLAELQATWSVYALFAFIVIGAVAAFFNPTVGVAVGGFGAVLAVLFKIDAALIHVTMNQRAQMELHKQVVRGMRESRLTG